MKQAPLFKVGDLVIWTNEYGVNLGIRRVTEVTEDKFSYQYFLSPNEAGWSPIRERNLAKASFEYKTYLGSF
ncbi:hypothetical protein QN372_00280 [Undibacterium sp. RTI2.1]|uniref:hypothetical protein n=1 Tax=unclassified Undibacterium TaxID=2630295 RepID=UPI002AB40A07|nr:MULTISPECIES: hypothetical protein [unclassified Undibacterium]MDY7537575.1 hypothetical protein [Undibacterium sp. 5I1]MEB0029175.1 hypothetical protein [Undibacterium sp. RTI2.1]MEB0115483.1 hypothetical protein [Undibacterium sp. RTI2.2]MEB0231960.1 hypothetical protein [Undibacterium sp. 10I3]MEB0256311.1 hypothetical protein [Undibacterium sp. 5I1]